MVSSLSLHKNFNFIVLRFSFCSVALLLISQHIGEERSQVIGEILFCTIGMAGYLSSRLKRQQRPA